MKIFIKNMVCDRCIVSVKDALESEDILFANIKLGEVELRTPLSHQEMDHLDVSLKNLGFEIIQDKSPVLANQIKSKLISLYNETVDENLNISDYLAKELHYDYAHLSRIFSQSEEQTIEQYNILLRIEKAKELLTYPENNIAEVAYKLGYVSNAHFSRQFKKIVGVSPSDFKKDPDSRKSLEKI